MNLYHVNVGEVLYGAIPDYGEAGRFLQGWKVKPCRVVQVSDKSIFVAFDKATEKRPQRFSKTVSKCNGLQSTELEVWKELGKNKQYLRSMDDQIQRNIKRLEKRNNKQ